MSLLNKIKAQLNPFDHGATFSNPNPMPLYRGQLNVPTAGPGTQLQSGPGVQYQQPPNQSLNQPGLTPGLTPQTSPGLVYTQPIQSQLQVQPPTSNTGVMQGGDPGDLQFTNAYQGDTGQLPQGAQYNPGFTPLQNSGFGPGGNPQIGAFTSPFLPSSFYTRRRR